MDGGTRAELFERLSAALASLSTAHPLRVAIDGPPAAGKTRLGDELGERLQLAGRPVIRTSADRFMFQRAMRYRQGVDSALGCYEDSFNYEALRRELLDPLGPAGDRVFRDAIYDWDADAEDALAQAVACPDAVLVVDGVFLQRPQLRGCWDFVVYVTAEDETLFARARVRDSRRLTSGDEAQRRFEQRYLPAQELYRAQARPVEKADVVVDNDELGHPRWRFCADG